MADKNNPTLLFSVPPELLSQFYTALAALEKELGDPQNQVSEFLDVIAIAFLAPAALKVTCRSLTAPTETEGSPCETKWMFKRNSAVRGLIF